jgi:hypothetical protein
MAKFLHEYTYKFGGLFSIKKTTKKTNEQLTNVKYQTVIAVP